MEDQGKPLANFRVHVEMVITPGVSAVDSFAGKALDLGDLTVKTGN